MTRTESPTCSTNPRPDRRRRRGFGLAEGLIASTFLAIAVVGIAGPLAASHEQTQTIQERSTAFSLARQLLGEIAAKPLADDTNTSCRKGPELNRGETDRTRFDSADDYHGYRDTTNGLSDLAGNTVGFATATYARDVTVEYRTTVAGASMTAGDFALVTVTITTPGKQAVQVSRLLTRQSLAR
jgi:Tfp pilus assembly protein PilV